MIVNRGGESSVVERNHTIVWTEERGGVLRAVGNWGGGPE